VLSAIQFDGYPRVGAWQVDFKSAEAVEQARQQRVDAVSNEPSHTTGVVTLPDRIGRKNDIGGPR
jgi:hypothetical protein